MEPMETDAEVPGTSDGNSGTPKKARQAVTNVRYEGKINKMTRLGKTGIQYWEEKDLGKGSFASVYEGCFKRPERKAAVKRVLGKYADISKNEIDIWSEVGKGAVKNENINIVQLYHWTPFQDRDTVNYYFAMELATGDLRKQLEEAKKSGNVTLEQWRIKAVGYLQDAASGLKWLHTKRVIHRDIKPENILIFCGPDSDIAKLADFGISKHITEFTGTDTLAKGTYDWMSPETYGAVMENTNAYITKAVDIFSFGMTAHYTLTMGEHPFKWSKKFKYLTQMNILMEECKPAKIGNGKYTADHLCQWMMSHEESQRPNIRQVVKHPMFWKTQKQFKLVLDVAMNLDAKNAKVLVVKDKINKKYSERHQEFNWREKLGEPFLTNLFKRKSSPAKKINTLKYNGTSLTWLLKLIRDKYVHQVDILDELITTDEYFGEKDNTGDWMFSEEKYVNFFLTLFPDLAIFLFVFLIKTKDVGVLKNLRWKLLEYNGNMPGVPLY